MKAQEFKYSASYNGVVVGERKSPRTYSHAIVVVRSEDYARKQAAEAGSAVASNFAYYSRGATVTLEQFIEQQRADFKAKGHDSIIQLYEPKWSADHAAAIEFAAKHPTVESYRAWIVADQIAKVDAAKAEGRYSKPYVATWCGRLDLAQKAINQYRNSFYASAAVVPVNPPVPVAHKAKKEKV